MHPYDGKKILVGLSGGINSMAVLCWLIEAGIQPKELHLFYAHFMEHSPDTFKFVADGIRLARKHFTNVVVNVTRNSVLEYFGEKKKMIPHPQFSPCSHDLKIDPIEKYIFNNDIQIDLVGYVREEKKRIASSKQHKPPTLFLSKEFPIDQFTDAWCFVIVDKYIGWHPAIYDILDEDGRRVFEHNNCLPCKNMRHKQLLAVKKHYPVYMRLAVQLSERLKSYWGRNAVDYYTSFGREDYEAPQCAHCAFD